MQLFDWETVRKEQMNPKIWRKVITGEKMTLAQIFIAKDGIVPRHQHENEQISYLAQGVLQFEIDGQEITVHKGEVIHIPANVPHGVIALEDTLSIEMFSPIRKDWLTGNDDYLRKT